MPMPAPSFFDFDVTKMMPISAFVRSTSKR